MRKIALWLLLNVAISFAPVNAAAPRRNADYSAIMAVLAQYQAAVSRQDEAAFGALLLSKDIPFAYVPAHPTNADASSWRDYEGFRRGVFHGTPFTQRFRDIRIDVHGALADVTLVYVNTTKRGSQAGWKTMQLIKLADQWKIASEFFTALPAKP